MDGLIDEADEIIYVSEVYTDGCIKKRNQHMVNRSDYCICALIQSIGGTAQTVRYARNAGIKIIRVV